LIRKGEHERANSRQSGCAAACCRRGEGLFREGERCQDRPRRTGQGSAPARPWRYADGDAARPAARSTRNLLNILDAIGKARAGFKSLADPWADTTTPHGKLMVTVLAGLAEFERSLILARTGEGRARAKAKGVKFGHPLACPPPAQGSDAAPRGGRRAGRSCAVVRCFAGDHQQTGCPQPFRGRHGRRVRKKRE
jgi:hypothetical protein